MRFWIAIPVASALLLAALLGARAYVYQPFRVASASMEPTANPRDNFLVSKLAYAFSSPQRGDVVVFYSRSFKADYVKRIVGLPGDRVQMKHGILYINNMPVPQHRVPNFIEPCGASSPCQVSQYEEHLPGGQSHTILDRVPNGPSDNTDAFLVPANSYFVLGDNRDNSDDSRQATGFVARADVVGRAAYKYIADGQWTWQAIN